MSFVHPMALKVSADLSDSDASSHSEYESDSEHEAARVEALLIHSLSVRRSQALDTMWKSRASEASQAATAEAEEPWNNLLQV